MANNAGSEETNMSDGLNEAPPYDLEQIRESLAPLLHDFNTILSERYGILDVEVLACTFAPLKEPPTSSKPPLLGDGGANPPLFRLPEESPSRERIEDLAIILRYLSVTQERCTRDPDCVWNALKHKCECS